jgi:CheY-like chemotaxis protein
MMSNTSNSLPPEKDIDLKIQSLQKGLASLIGLRILVIDDNEDNLFLASFILEEYGVEVLTATSACEGFEIFTQTKPDILISDITMPGEDGYSLMRRIRNLEPELGGEVPAIALTASARNEDRTSSFEAGFQMHVPKPIEPDELVKIVTALAKRFFKK